jgi:hypothetical protein
MSPITSDTVTLEYRVEPISLNADDSISASLVLGYVNTSGAFIAVSSRAVVIPTADADIILNATPASGFSRRGDLERAIYVYMVAEGIVSGTVPYVDDNFGRPDSITSLGLADSGQTWVALAGTWGLDAGRAKLITDSGANNNSAVVDSSLADGIVSVTWAVAQNNQRIVVRATDASNHFIVDNDAGIALALFRRQAAGYTLLGTGGVVPASGDVMSVVLNGSSIIVKQNGTQVISVTDAFQSTATKHGIGAGAVGASRWDAFSVRAL